MNTPLAVGKHRASRIRRDSTLRDSIQPEASPLGAYDGYSEISGPLQHAADTVEFVEVMTAAERRTLTVLSLCVGISGVLFIGWLLWPVTSGRTTWLTVVMCGLMAAIELIRLGQSATLAIFMSRARDALPQVAPGELRVALMTTMVPGKEPWEMIEATLVAMKNVTYDGGVDVWLLDEGNDAVVASRCARMGVRHFSRKGIDAYNEQSGQFKTKTKHGNHNAWLDAHGSSYDIVGQMDPDHVPVRDFLERTLGYFNDPHVAYVVAPQVYGNLFDNWIAKGAAVLAYVFHGVIQRGGNGLDAPLLIGTNHLYRVKAWQQIGGYLDFKVEDHATGMAVLATRVPGTAKNWQGIYTKDILNVGEGPTTFFDWFQQQSRWAVGIWEIVPKLSPRLLGDLTGKQRAVFIMLQSFYPSVAVGWVLSNLLSALYVLTNYLTGKPFLIWMLLWLLSIGTSMILFFWLRRFNLVAHERNEVGTAGLVLMLITIPTYVTAMFQALLSIKTPYGVTAKGTLAKRQGGIKVFKTHLAWALASGTMLAVSLSVSWASGFWTLRFWLGFTLAICLTPVVLHYTMLRDKRTDDIKVEHDEFEDIVDIFRSHRLTTKTANSSHSTASGRLA